MICALGGLCMALAATPLGAWGLALIYQSRLAGYEYLLVPLFAITTLTALIWFLVVILTIFDQKKLMVMESLAGLAVLLALALTLIPSLGMDGVNITAIVSQGVIGLAMTVSILRRISRISPEQTEKM